MSERTPEQIIGHDALMQLVFEGYEVIKSAELSELREDNADLSNEVREHSGFKPHVSSKNPLYHRQTKSEG